MKKIAIILSLALCVQFAKAQFPTNDSAQRFTNKWIRNSAIDAFTNLRLNTVLIYALRQIDSTQILSFAAVNDSTIRLITKGKDTFTVVVHGVGGGGSGTVGSGNQYQLAYYSANGTAVSGLTAITGNRAVATDVNGLPVASATTATEIGYVNGVTSSIQTQLNNKLTNAESEMSVTGAGTTGSKLKLVNDEDTPNKWEFYGTNIKDSTKGYREIEETFYGLIYDKNTWTDLSDFSNNGGTFSVVSNKIRGSAGAGNFTQSLDLLQFTNLQKWTIVAKVRVDVKDANSFGFGFGIRSYNDYGLSNQLGRFVASTGTGTGTVIQNGSTNNAQLSQSSALTFSANDYILITVERNSGRLTTTARNLTTNSAEVSTSYDYSYSAAPYLPNTGRFAVYSFGGQFTIDSLAISSKEVKNARLMVIGDSKTEGYLATLGANTYGYLLNSYYKSTIKHAAGFDRTIDVSRGVPEILALRPQQVTMAIGSNDIRSAVDSTTYCNRYDSIVTALTNAGIDVYHLLAFYESSINVSPLVNHVNLVYPASKIIDTHNPLKATGALNADGVHPNDYGNRIIYNTVVQSFKIYGGNERYGGSGSSTVSASGTAGTLAKFTATSTLENSSLSEVPGRVTSTNSIEVSTSGSPGFSLNKTSNGTNEKIFNYFTDGNDVKLSLVDDARTTNVAWLQANRTGTTVNYVGVPNGEFRVGSLTDQGAFTFQNTGGLYQNGQVSLRGTALAAAPSYLLFKQPDSTVSMATTVPVNMGGTGQKTYTNGQLLIGNTTGNTLTKATLSEGTGIDITNGSGSVTISVDPSYVNQAVKDSAGYYTITGTTTDATPTNLVVIPFTDGYHTSIEATCVAITSDGDNGYHAIKVRPYLKNSSSGLISGALTTLSADQYFGSLTTATFTLTNSGVTAVIQVTGEAATTIHWKVRYKLVSVNVSL